MFKTSLILILLLTASDAAEAKQNSAGCTPKIPDPNEFQQSFSIVTSATIPKDTQCTWPIKQTDPQKVMIYLRVDGPTTENQCISIDKQPNGPHKICGTQKKNTYTSNGQEMSVTYTYAGVGESASNFMVMYKFANSDYCTTISPVAMENEQSFGIIKVDEDIPKNVHCSWTITTPNSQKIVVRLDDTTTAEQCISVSNTPDGAGQKICGKQSESTFTSQGQEVTVTYLAPQQAVTVKNFKVYYKSENSKECSTTIPDASAVQQSFSITTKDTISKGTQCMWTVKAPNPQKVLVYLAANGTTTENQCITVDNKPPKESKQICGKQNQNTFTSDAQEMTVAYTYTGEAESVPNFMVMYKFGNSDACTVTSPMATDSEQSFDIIKMGENIPANIYCSWLIPAPSSKKIVVQLTTEGTSTENQCVSVSNNPNEAGEEICGKPNKNTFTSQGQNLVVTYPAPNSASGVKNFKVLYKTSGARQDTAWISGILSVYILSRLLL